jgi:DnaJ domain
MAHTQGVTVRLDGDLYVLLGVTPSATAEEITRAFRARAKELHPDVRPDDAMAAEEFKELGQAYRVLVDPDRRATYDRGRVPAPAPRSAVPVHQPVLSTPRRARLAMWSGVALVVLGIASSVVLGMVDTGDTAKAITLWLVAGKLLVCGAIVWGVGAWRLHRLRTVPTGQ